MKAEVERMEDNVAENAFAGTRHMVGVICVVHLRSVHMPSYRFHSLAQAEAQWTHSRYVFRDTYLVMIVSYILRHNLGSRREGPSLMAGPAQGDVLLRRRTDSSRNKAHESVSGLECVASGRLLFVVGVGSRR
jgi:hypothetical protein